MNEERIEIKIEFSDIPPGSYVIDENGNLVPNPNDEKLDKKEKSENDSE